MILRSDAVESIFGYWPEFADAKVLRLAYESNGTICLDISYIDAKQGKGAVIGLRFTEAKDVALTDLLSENVLDRLHISEGAFMRVELEACYGLSGSFSCMGAEVTGVALGHPFKSTTLSG